MSTTAIVVIVIVVLILLAIVLVAVPRWRARARERQLDRHRGEVAGAHRDQAASRAARADEAEQIAARERAEAELHEARARLHERGLADDELAVDRERLGVDDETADPAVDPRDERDMTVPPARGDVPPEERTTPG
jgi:type II secretory pathway pseudopilin PulG